MSSPPTDRLDDPTTASDDDDATVLFGTAALRAGLIDIERDEDPWPQLDELAERIVGRAPDDLAEAAWWRLAAGMAASAWLPGSLTA